ncbi:MAG: GtrA family protein [Caulobacteraceae bacterium]
MVPVFGRGVRFVLVGIVCTVISFVVFVCAIKTCGYLIAAALSWAAGVCFGFALNRRVTFGISGVVGVWRELILFLGGSLAQLGLGLFDYWILIGNLKLPAGAAFIINLAVGASAMFAWLNLAVFSRSLGFGTQRRSESSAA